MVVNETMQPFSQLEVPTYLLRSKRQVVEIVPVLSVKRTLWVERPFNERIRFHLFLFADVLDALGDRFLERDKGIAFCNQFLN